MIPANLVSDFGEELASLRVKWDWQAALKGVAVVALASGAGFLLYKLNGVQWEWTGLFRPSTRELVRNAYLHSFASTTLTAVPGSLLRLAGWRNVFPKYFGSPWILVLSTICVGTLYAIAMFYPRDDLVRKHLESHKRQLFIGSSLALGALIAPLFTWESRILALIGGFTLSVVTPMAAVACVARNRLFLNVAGISAMTLSAVFMQSEVVPRVFHGVLESAPLNLLSVSEDAVSIVGFVGFSAAMLSALMVLGTANSIVNRAMGASIFPSEAVTVVEERQETAPNGDVIITRTTKKPQSEQGSLISPSNPVATIFLEGVKPDDPMELPGVAALIAVLGMGLFINLHTTYVFIKIAWAFVKFFAELTKHKDQDEKRSRTSKSAAFRKRIRL